MRSTSSIALICSWLTTAVLAQDFFEAPDFNVTKALIANGVDIPSLPLSAEANFLRPRSDACSIACTVIASMFGKLKVSLDKHPDYWSNQQDDVNPRCTVSPTAALEVSTLVLLSRLTRCPFAVKSGGHAAFPGASNIEGGITVDLAKLNTLKLSSDRKTFAVGPGNRWYDVYAYLNSYALAVVGGRASTVGVGGLTLGGGISHHTNKYGLACDNVASYEVVTASGRIVTTSPRLYPDLYWALRGGGNNFGIVTSFNFETFAQGPMWGGYRRHDGSEIPRLVEAFVNTTIAAEQDGEAAHTLSISAYSGFRIASTELEYTSPVDTAHPPEILREYLSIPAVQDDTTNLTLADLTPHLSADMPSGFRTTMWSASFKLDGTLINAIANHLFEVAPNFPAVSVSAAIQAFSVPALRAMQKKGGNALGLRPEDGPFFHVLFYSAWNSSSDDAAMMKGAKAFIDTTRAVAKEHGLDNDYIYMPYSSGYQEVVSSYGAENQQKLKVATKKYDPQGVFQKLQPGGFKLDGAPFGTKV